VCGSVDGDDIYDFDNAGDALSANAPNLCAEGDVLNFSYNPTTHEWTWECEGTFGGSNDVCIATELRCGDGIQNGSEQCDDGNTTNGDGCNNDCTTSSPGVCGSVNGNQIYDFDNAGDALNANSPNLCQAGQVASFSYDPVNHIWSRVCQ
jgi:cysteine-rich repeat protein